MPLFGSTTTRTTSVPTRRRGLFQRTKPSRTTRIKNAIDPTVTTTTHTTRVPFMTRVKRTLGIRSKPKRRGTFSRFQPRTRRTRQTTLI
ncbi:hypothetical protein MIND_00692400 [Mycena indigotica]|uniref:Uncharacterized protein n=1 Tax=Mycena indigotica TaxID=2126181 RepID=A0A8H6W380_9AGAR|nr:uncharacterized protein MIND_00692400 [Mycena indigotica]KAF7301276.1 hypothetical protein MIND_00692400 [Mycena indigotica]